MTNTSGVSSTGYVTVKIRDIPVVQITSPDDGSRTNAPANVTISGTSFDYDGSVTNVDLYLIYANSTNKIGSTTNPNFSFNWSTNLPGFYTFVAVATDNSGYTNSSAGVTLQVYNTLGIPPVAIISSPVATVTNVHGIESIVYPVVRDGQYTNLIGSAYDPDDTDDSYGVFLYRPDDPNTIFANVTPLPRNSQGFHVGAVTNASLGALDLSTVPNGIYDLVLTARGGGDETNAIVRVSIDTQLKIGQFSFSEQDLVIPVNGIPLTVVRTYNSFNPVQGDFGFNWTYAINDMDVVIDEDRTTVAALDTLEPNDNDDSSPLAFSLRTGGGRNVTLTLPNGQRTTFLFTFVNTAAGDTCPGCVDAQWIPAPGVYATLRTPNPATNALSGDNTLLTWTRPLSWNAATESTPMDAYDFPTFILTTQDGTQYQIDRDVPGQPAPSTYSYIDDAGYFGTAYVPYWIKPHPGKPKLTKITQRTLDTIEINSTTIVQKNPSGQVTRTVYFERDPNNNRITAIHDPISGSSGTPVVKYIYNQDTGNLIQVLKLVDRSSSSYATNFYHYDNPNFPHYITEIDDARGIPAARSLYDDSGRLIGIIDADGRTNTITHDLTGRTEQIVDRLGKTNIYAYDTRGNVSAITNALNQVTLYAYDELNNKTNEVIGGIQTNAYVWSTNGLLLQSVIGGIVTNNFTYNINGQVLASTDGRGNVTTNQYDSSGNLTNVVTLLSTNRSTFDSTGRLSSTVDPLGNFTTNLYDNIGNVTNVTVRDAANNLLSKTSYTYDSNGNRQSQSVQRTLADQITVTNAVTTYVYDAENRLTQTIDPDGKTNIVVYNEIGKQTQTIDKIGRTTSFFYDARGNLTNVTYADLTFEQYFYDAEGHRTNTTDRAGRLTTSLYDAVGRLTTTTFPDTVSSNVTVYDVAGRVFQTIDARGTITGFKYDAPGRRVAVTNTADSRNPMIA